MLLQRLSGNRLKYAVWLLVLSALMLGGGVLLAQEGQDGSTEPWAVYLSSFETLQIQQFNGDGSVVTHQLEPGTENALSGSAAFSPDETKIAYCATPPFSDDPNATPPPPINRVVVRDLAAGSSLFEAEIGELSACNLTTESFSLDGSRVAVGTIPPFPGGPEMPEGEASWTLYVLDAASGDTIATLDSLSPELSALGIDTAQTFMMPYVRRVEGDLVTFALVNWFTEGLPSYDAFVWDTSANTVTEAPLWGRPFADEIRTADGFEFVYTMLDENQPAANPGGPMPEANTVVVQREGGEPVVVYTNTEEIIMSVRYINDGAALAIGLLGAFEMEGDVPVDQPQRFVMLSRDGTLTDLTEPVVNGSVDVRPVPGGYIHYVRTFNPEDMSTTGTLNANIGGEATTLWTDEPGSQGWNLIYATQPDLSGVSLPEFTPAS